MKLVRAKKALGQHFLNDLDIAKRIALSLSSHPLPILEVGPGMGVLTRFLLDAYPEVKVIEIDSEAVEYLREHFPGLRDAIIASDFLRLDLRKVYDGRPFMVIGNYPYNISSQIFFHILEYRDLIPVCGGMLQREVAMRLASPPGNKDYGILSVLLRAWYDIEYLFTVDEHVFTPPPKVKSGVIRLVRNNRTDLGCEEKLFKTIVKTTFNRRRKTIRNSLKPITGDTPLPNDHPLLGKRPEQLDVQEFVELTRMVSEILSKN